MKHHSRSKDQDAYTNVAPSTVGARTCHVAAACGNMNPCSALRRSLIRCLSKRKCVVQEYVW
jgi:hypothetical protein